MVHLHGVEFGVPLQIGADAGSLFSVGYAGCGFEGPTVVDAGAVQGARYNGVEVELVGADGAFEDRTQFYVARIWQELGAHEGELCYEA